jgi:hypothetical protein
MFDFFRWFSNLWKNLYSKVGTVLLWILIRIRIRIGSGFIDIVDTDPDWAKFLDPEWINPDPQPFSKVTQICFDKKKTQRKEMKNSYLFPETVFFKAFAIPGVNLGCYSSDFLNVVQFQPHFQKWCGSAPCNIIWIEWSKQVLRIRIQPKLNFASFNAKKCLLKNGLWNLFLNLKS